MPNLTPNEVGMQASPSYATYEELYQIIGELFVTRGKTSIEYRRMLIQADEMAEVITNLRMRLEQKDQIIAHLQDVISDTNLWQIGRIHS